jgi:pimeloyl-ACP methyl ester carboxylesterase
MAQQMADAQFETIAKAGHAVFLDQPEIFKELLAKFLARVGG